MKRRTFIKQFGFGGIGLSAVSSVSAASSLATPSSALSEVKADVVVVGGGTGGVAAALAAARNGLNVIITEETDWIGGQLTTQAVPPDEHPWIEAFGATRAYQEFRTRVRDYYRRNFPITEEVRTRSDFNPGNGRVSRLCHEPRVAHAVFYEMLAQYLGGGRLRIRLHQKPVSSDTMGDRVTAVEFKNLLSGRQITLTAPYFVDATELGDLLSLTKTEYVTGSESQAETGEPHASPKAKPGNVQAFTCCFAMDYIAGEDHTIEKPKDYEFWRNYVPALKPAWPGRLLDWNWSDPKTLLPREGCIDPLDKYPDSRAASLWLYRRIADKRNFIKGTYPSDITLVNWFQNDYWEGNLIDSSPDEAARHVQSAKQLSLSLLYWLQTEAPRLDGGIGWRGLRLRKDLVDTEDGLAKYPYIRESRRIKAEFTVLEQHVSTEARMQKPGQSQQEVKAEFFPDSVGVGSYRIDLHPSSGGDNFIDLSSLPFQIPLGSLVPQRVENLLPACKNIGTTHITNGCYRLHPVEWNIGESVGMLVAFCHDKKVTPRQVRNNPKLLDDFQRLLQLQGIEIQWPRLTAR